MSSDINHKEQANNTTLSKQQEVLLIFKKHYDFLEKLANYSSNCHNYLNHLSIVSFPTLGDINTQEENIASATKVVAGAVTLVAGAVLGKKGANELTKKGK